MKVRLNQDLEARLADIASARGCDAEALAREAIERFLDYEEVGARRGGHSITRVVQSIH